MSRECDIFYVEDKKTYDLDVDGIGDRKCRVVVEPVITVQPGTMRQRNLPMELSNAGAKVVFIPRNDTLNDFRDWMPNVGEMVGAGLDRATALRAVTSEPAALLGLESRLGSLEKGKDANMVFLNGEPFEPTTRIQAVMLEGRFVYGEVKL
jgi:cytosine/adenosine deaminase-related metal-dependent hydrolase